jgi:hypothetical protein
LNFFDRLPKKYSGIEFHENPFSGSRVIPYGRTDKHDEANRRFSHFSEGALNKRQNHHPLLGAKITANLEVHKLHNNWHNNPLAVLSKKSSDKYSDQRRPRAFGESDTMN